MHRTTAWGLKAVLVALGAFLAAASSPSLPGAGPVGQGGSAADPRRTGSSAERSAHRGATAASAKAGASKPKRTHDASQTSISGTVTDGSGHGWPLYAMLEFTSDSTEPLEVYSDPVTGQYQASLFDGIAYSVAVASLEGGYRPAGGTLTADGTPLVRDWALAVDAYACQAPGYQANGVDAILSEGFDAGVLPAGWSIDTFSGASWKIWDAADPCGAFPGNDTGGTGPFALLNSNCDSDHLNFDDSSLVTPSLDLTGLSSAALFWNNEYRFFFSTADVDVSTDGGGSWTNLWERIGIYEWGPQVQSVDLSPFVGQAGVLVRFHYRGFNAWWWQVDNVIVGQPLCSPVAGGLVVGNVLDANTGAGVNGATVSSATDVATTTSFDPGDPSHGAGFFYLFQPAGPQMLEASSQAYSPDSQTVTVFNNDAVRRDFALQAGRLDASPRPVVVAIPPDGLAMKTLTVTNSGAVDASFQLIELNTPLLASTTAGFASGATRDQSLARLPKDEKGRPVTNARSAAGLAGFSTSPLEHPTAPHVAAGGTVIGAFPTGITYAWGVGAFGTDVWLSNIAVAGGDNLDYQYTGDGVRTGQTIDDNAFLTGGDWAADGAFNSRTGTIWRVKVGEGENGENCLHEIDPTTKTVTGNMICGDWAAVPQHGVAYDASTDTYFVGGWNDLSVYHIDATGTILDSAFVGLPISGLAYNASNGHLLAMLSTDAPMDVAVLDALHDYALLDAYQILDGGAPVFAPYEQAGMEFDCLGNLWVVNQVTQMLYKVATAESSFCNWDIPWLTVSPTAGTVPGAGLSAGSLPITLTFNSTGLLPGLRQGQIQFGTDTPYTVGGVPVALTVLFNDVPEGSFAWNYIYGAAAQRVMPGGPPNCGPTVYTFCPNGVVTRADMAGYLFSAIHGRSQPPPVYQNIFGDVTFNDYNAFYIQGIFDDGITAGCGGGNYCPDAPNTRAQMSVFIWKGQHGDAMPPACTGVFTDVPCPGGFAVDYIEGLYYEGITAGCGGGNFCPNANISNAQMAVFLVKAFDIPHLP